MLQALIIPSSTHSRTHIDDHNKGFYELKKKKDLLEAIGKDNPSIITKWLSGTHNFTVETLIDLEKALDIRLIDREFKQVPIMEYRINVSSSMDNSEPFSYINDILNSTTLGPSKKALVFQIN